MGSTKMDNTSEKAPSEKSNKEPEKKNEEDKKSVESGKKKEEKKERIKNFTSEAEENIIKCVKETCEKIKEGEQANKIGEIFQKALEKNFPTGWNVIVGSHFFALCVHEEKMCIQFEIDEFRVAIYKSYVPASR